jgi:hypothetical protein
VDSTVANLDRLRGQGADANEPQLSHTQQDVDRNSPNPTDPLPYTPDGNWDGNTILTRLGQYDRLSGTDSDSKRCVQAVAMASRIPAGPDAVAGYLSSITFDSLLGRDMNDRRRTAMRVINLVKDRLRARRGTYGDLSWAQEAVHDLFYNDFEGTPETEIQQQINPTLESLNRDVTSMNVWCNSPAEVLAQTTALAPGAQLIVNAWSVVFNSAWDQVSDRDQQGRDRMQVQINGRQVWIRRINTDHRPNARDIQFPSDSKSGHQLLIMKDNNATGTLRLYEPEITQSGTHLLTLDQSGSQLQQYLTDNAQYGIFGYIQITGRIVPSSLTSAFGASGNAAQSH